MKKQKKEEAEAGKGTSRIQPSKEGKPLSSREEIYIDDNSKTNMEDTRMVPDEERPALGQ